MGGCASKSSIHDVQSVHKIRADQNSMLSEPNSANNTFSNSMPLRKMEVDYSVIPNKLHKTFSLSQADGVFGLMGLSNLGNTCFMNAALQCLSNITPLTDYFLNNIHTKEINKDNVLGSKGAVALAYADLLNKLWGRSDAGYITPSEFYKSVGQYAPQFSYGTQEDAHEFIAYLLDMIHEDLNRVKKRPKVNDEIKGRTAEEQAQESWKNYLLRNKSIIVDLFQGQSKSSLKCLACGYQSLTFETFMYLSLPIPEEDNNDNFTLIDCLKEFSKEERLEGDEKWYCPKCKEHKNATKRIEIWKLPNILIIHFKRFKFTRHKRGKIRALIDFPIYDLDLTNLVTGKQKDKPIFDLFAIANHDGTLGRGHYHCFAKNRDDSNWYSFNDNFVKKVDQLAQLLTSSAYLLFYSKTSPEFFKRQTISKPEAWPHFIRKSTQRSEARLDDESIVAESPFSQSTKLKDPRIQINNITNQKIKINNININNSHSNLDLEENLQRRGTQAKRMKNSVMVFPKDGSGLPSLNNSRMSRVLHTEQRDVDDSIYQYHTEHNVRSGHPSARKKFSINQDLNLSQDRLDAHGSQAQSPLLNKQASKEDVMRNGYTFFGPNLGVAKNENIKSSNPEYTGHNLNVNYGYSPIPISKGGKILPSLPQYQNANYKFH
jgi:ubiquitin carboxyl-terminal hydrolase 8